MAACAHMEKYGTTQRQLAVISSKNHYHSSMNPLAQYANEFSPFAVNCGLELPSAILSDRFVAVNRAAHKALRIHGGFGYPRHREVEQLYGDARVPTLYEGSSEPQRIAISREMLEVYLHLYAVF